MRSAAWVLILGLVLAAQWEVLAGGAGGIPAAVLVAGGAAEDATSSNNQVKIVPTPAGLVVAYAAAAGGIPQVALAVSHDGGARWAPLAEVSSGPVPSRLATLARDRAGRLHVIWTRYDGGVGKIYRRIWQGRWIGPQERISPESGYAGYPALALDSAGHDQVVWYGIRTGGVALTRHASIYEIYYTGFDGRAWSSPLLLSTGLPDAVNPALASDPTGRLYAVWYQYDARTYQIRYAERSNTWSAPESIFHTQADEFNPDVTAGADGRVSLAWEHHGPQGSVIEYTQRGGGQWEEPVALSGGGSSAHHPSVAVTSAGDAYVLWDQEDGQIYLRHRAAGTWEPAVRLTAEGGNTFPSASPDGAGIDAVWTHAAPSGAAVYFVRVGPRTVETSGRTPVWTVGLAVLAAALLFAVLRLRRHRRAR